MLKLKKRSYKLTADSRLTIPKAFRDHWGLKPGDKIHFEMLPGGGVMIGPATDAVRRRGASEPADLKKKRKL